MTRRMYDSTTPAQIPADAQMVAGYVNGLYRWDAADWARFPRDCARVHIDVDGSAWHVASVLDIERFDASPQDFPGWAKARLAVGLAWPTAYCSRSNADVVLELCRKAGLADADWFLGVATLDGTILPADAYPNLAYCQAFGAARGGPNYDLSVVYRDDWHPQPTAAPAPDRHGWLISGTPPTVRPLVSTDAGRTWH